MTARDDDLRADLRALADEWIRNGRTNPNGAWETAGFRIRAVLDAHESATEPEAPSIEDDRKRGLYGKYHIERIDDPTRMRASGVQLRALSRQRPHHRPAARIEDVLAEHARCYATFWGRAWHGGETVAHRAHVAQAIREAGAR